MTTSEIILHILTTIITIGATVGAVLYLVKGLISTNRKDYIKMFALIAIVVLVNLLAFYFFF